MEPVTHVLTGACLARTGLNRRAAYATAAMAVAAEFPDIDTVWAVRGPISSFQHHRGITHTFVGLPLEAALLLFLFWLLHRWRVRRGTAPVATSGTIGRGNVSAPTNWPLLYVFILLALLSHLLLDFTNNYGIRPFFPFNTHWYAASIVFIFDPLLFAFLLMGLILPSFFGLINREVGASRPGFPGAGWARTALVLVVALWGLRAYEHSTAIELAKSQVLEAPVVSDEAARSPETATAQSTDAQTPKPRRPLLPPLRSIANPDPLSVFRWYTATDFGPAYRLGVADTKIGALAEGQILPKPATTPNLRAAELSRLGRVYLDWSVMPWVTSNEAAIPGQRQSEVTVTFEDLRFLGSTPLLHGSHGAPLTGEVVLDRAGNVVASGMDGRFER